MLNSIQLQNFNTKIKPSMNNILKYFSDIDKNNIIDC